MLVGPGLSIGAMLPSLCLGHLDKYSDGMIRFGHLVGVHDDKIKAYVNKLNTHICIAIILLQTKMTISPRWYHPPNNQFRH
jgi:hypothetical protein